MGFRLNHKRIGPFRVNLSMNELRNGRLPVSSVSLDLGAPVVRLWSRDGTRGLTSIDTPGQGSYRFDPRSKQARRPTQQQGAEQQPIPPLSYDPNGREASS